MLVLDPYAEPGALRDVVFLCAANPGVMDASIQQVYPMLILAVVTPDIRSRAVRLDNHGDPMELGMPWVEDMTGHGHTAAPQNLSNADISSPATACGERPSI
jgi:hypothetical protein